VDWHKLLEEAERKSGIRRLEISSTATEMEEMVKSLPWIDMEHSLASMLILTRDLLETLGVGPNPNITPGEIPFALGFLQGKADALRVVLEMPNVILEDLKNREKEEEDGG